MENQLPTAARLECGACNASNRAEAKFCAGCGQSLFEACGTCGKSVLLTQSYCGECGADLDQMIRVRRERHEGWMADAVAAAKDHDYVRAKELLARVAELTDYRFRDEASDAAKAIEKIRAIEQRTLASVQTATELARQAYASGNQHEVARHLSGIPFRLLDEDAKTMFNRAQAYTQQWASLESEARAAIAEKSWIVVGRCVQQLLELDAAHAPYRKLAEQVAGKLVAEARQALDDGNYDHAVAKLDAIPELVSNQEIRDLREKAENIHWLSEQFDGEPFASPLLGRLAVRLAKETPKDPRTQKLVKQLADQLKQAPRPLRGHLPTWKATARSWMGGELGILSLPVSIDFSRSPEFKVYGGRWNVALGLAMQGLGLGRIGEDLLIRKKGLLSFGKRKLKSCWGIDVGSSSLKAVCLEAGESKPQVVDSYFVEFDVPLCKRGGDVNPRDVLAPVIERFLETKQPEDQTVWVNLSGSHTINRFVRLPPVKEKDASKLLMHEIKQLIPIPLEELSIACWIRDLDHESTLGRPAVAVAARRTNVTARTDLLESCGLKVAGMQSDTLALANFGSYEFDSIWSRADGDDSPRNELLSRRSVAMIDCGASATNLVIVSGESQWFWTIETGGEDLTTLLARSTKTTRDEAEKLKRNPAALNSPAKQFHPLEHRLDEARVRLDTVYSDGMRQNSDWKVVQTWCMGGGCQAHQWIRRVLLNANPSHEAK